MSMPVVRRAAILAVTLMLAAAGLPPGMTAAPMAPERRAEPVDFWSPGWMHRDMWNKSESPEMQARMRRHWAFLNGEIPEAYVNAQSRIDVTPETLAKGRALYEEHCARCHGGDGLGRGEAGMGLSPSPALLAYMIQMPMTIDSYLLWSIAEGGEAFGTAMPAFKDELRRKEIWQIVAFMRAGFPAATPAP